MLIRRTVPLLLCCLVTPAVAEEPLPYLEVPPQPVEELRYHQIPHSAELGKPLKEEDFPEIPVDRISDLQEDAETVYRNMETGQFDREPMVEIAPRNYPDMQLPEPTVIPAEQPSAPPVNTIPAQRIVERQSVGEDRIFQELNARAAEEAELPPPPPMPMPTVRGMRRVSSSAPVAADAATLSVVEEAADSEQ
ncbi:hypothetical protein [Motiliproteus sediminis]|uniref:hypothetical protein n=1 Tax=Motiliproteus sediminis TaxID=1468178 RepID=UPI001AEF919A|nr:hypothetical protein [Motiliproteus sediminis]